MTPKPLSREMREAAHEAIRVGTSIPDEIIEHLLAAEQYWRELVKNRAPWVDDICIFCNELEHHRADCPWLLAQEG